ncbi:TKL protein kinase [Saprolegnia parasitica CBS 223.65]|uniref:TKL protein kinase n=1 Tax=Saprolegnia parasitica (strain CBS 223.65) TaxID=695850 RepID=A0A067CS78_SAPPC|nr:TKL protein kinase [Saprolegnia parasitica CBS 223.65]KDO29381.1 TKL protein kinase [Saprolegnia parasitica CBS 223.65]|eukprot:XP_012199884.1 TKL protein kinase [Saprolegnia parasitica CBS 223.65]
MWKPSGSIVGKTQGLDDLPLALQQDINDFLHFAQNRKQQKLVPRINKVDFAKAMPESDYAVCLQLQVLTKEYQEGWPISAMTTSIANMSLSSMSMDRGKFSIAVRIPKAYPAQSPDISCVTGGENVPVELKQGATFVLPWLQNGWPTDYSLVNFAEDLCKALEAPDKIPTTSFIAEQQKVFPLHMGPEHSTRTPPTELHKEHSSKEAAPANADLLLFPDLYAPPEQKKTNPFGTAERPTQSPHTSQKRHSPPPSSLPAPLLDARAVPTQDLLDLPHAPPGRLSPRGSTLSPRTPSFENGYRSNECYIKCKWNGEARRFAFDRSLSFAQLQESIRRLFQIPSSTTLTLLYHDSDGDKCLLSSDEELRAALSHFPETLVLHVDSKSDEATVAKSEAAVAAKAPAPKTDETTLREIKIEDVKLEKCIGVGSSCKVYKAMWRGTEVAIKKFSSLNAEQVNKEFKHEVTMMTHLGCHPCIVLLLAVCTTPRSIIFEYLPFSLFEQINGSQDPTKKIPPFPNTWQKRLQMIMDVARGLQFLHSFNIVHRDLKSLNLLITDEGRVKLADFGIAKVALENEFMTRCCGTYQWMAPEVIVSQTYSVSADIYSFGIVMWEICEASVPFADTPAALVAMAVIQENKRPTMSANIPTPLKDLITSCWDKEASVRPDAATIVSVLTNFLQASQATASG